MDPYDLEAALEALRAYRQDHAPESRDAADLALLQGWARNGRGRAATVRPALERMLQAFYQRPADYYAEGTPRRATLDDVDPSTPLGALLAAAHYRLELVEGRPLTPARLAVLAGVDLSRVRQLLMIGTLVEVNPAAKSSLPGRRVKGHEVRVTPESALAWLKARGPA
jgi:hypothetical protein